MKTFQGYYSYETPDHIQGADVTVTNKRLEIHLKDAHGNPRTVFWYWENVVKGEERPGGCVLHHTGLPLQTLIVPNGDFAPLAARQMGKKRRAYPVAYLTFFTTALIVVGLVVAAFVWIVPWLAGKAANALPVEYEVSMGEEAYQSLIKEYKILPKQTEQVNTFYKEMGVSSPYPIKITVVDFDQTNAFAVPGGHIVVFSGLLKRMQHPEELAALLAHESSHVNLRHTTRSLMQSLGTFTAVSLIFGDVTGMGAVLVENASQLKSLEYSRSLEKEADLNGLSMLKNQQIPGKGFGLLFKTLGDSGGSAPSEWLSSHPDLGRRAKYVEEKIVQPEPPMPAALKATWEQIRAGLK
ncbi:M48 family metallopeptidase [Chitinophaga sp.]|uniref:M48 family metallopeptidase n=1 Tax=Chitinophaga sp. TaxID=1869181 RepID=UPI002623AA84|nr:M48 family metallopeptidase [uncultured Chitinophaga sp.]